MATRSVHVFVHNETNLVLERARDHVETGMWSSDGRARPPEQIPAWTTVSMRSESDGGLLPEGTEARVTYAVGGEDILGLHWNNPLVGTNSYHQSTTAAHHAIRVGGEGSDAIVHFFFRYSQLRETGFLPSRDGFRFPNRWGDVPYSVPPLRGSAVDLKFGNARNGLCGGMVLAAADDFQSRMVIPNVDQPPPGEQDPLFLYLVDRLFATFSVNNISLMLKLMNPAYPDTDENVASWFAGATGRAGVMVHEEWPLIRADIDAGRPSPMFLVTVKSLNAFDLGKCHQVLAYAYQARADDVELRVYDPNQPGADDVALRFSTRTVGERVVVHHNVNVMDDDGVSLRPTYCFGRFQYTPRTPTVATRPRAETDVPRQVRLEHLGTELLSEQVTSSGTREYDVFDCGTKKFRYELVGQRQRSALTAHAVSYVDPRFEWMINGRPVPTGADQRWTVLASPSGHAFTQQYDPGASADRDVTITTTVDGANLVLLNEPGDGSYSLTVRVTVTEGGSGESQRAEMGVDVTGAREHVPGLNREINACIQRRLDELRLESPTAEAIAAAIYAQLGRPEDPLWDPDPLMMVFDEHEVLVDPDQALYDELAAVEAPPEEIAFGYTGARAKAVLTRTARTVERATVSEGLDRSVTGSVDEFAPDMPQ